MTEHEQGVHDALMYIHKIFEQQAMLDNSLQQTPAYDDLMDSMDFLFDKISTNTENTKLCKQTLDLISDREESLMTFMAS